MLHISCNAQTNDQKAITYALEKLEEVKENKFINAEKAYVIDAQENKVSYNKFKGKWLLIDFWSTGCGPCIKEFPALAEFYRKNRDTINVIAVSVDNKFKRYRASAKKYKIEVPHYFGGYTYSNPIFNLNIKQFKKEDGALNFRTTTPQYVLISPDGEIINKDFPKPSSKEFQAKLKQVFNAYR
ncbi:redoxin domain-containing protein [Flavobacteriaceae bacterium R38]|nr:redoxin domain-containing protein [Flavobacteriaceae bacterium R38]